MGQAISVREAILEQLYNNTPYTAPANYEIALLTTNPSDDTGTGLVEVSTSVWTNYARQVVANALTTGFTAPPGGTTSPQSVSNANKVDYGTATVTGTAPVLTGFALYDHANPTKLSDWGALSSTQTINSGDPVYFNAGQLVLQQ